MSILSPGFSERVFEFSFNAEYAERNRAVLAGAPSIPTQNEEKWLGYDVTFEVSRRGGAVHAIALQHKVPRFVDNLSSTNAHFWNAIGGPYFAFRLDTDQYNLIESIASAGLPGIEFLFCSPCFASRRDMNTHYLAKTVEVNSMWIDIAGAGAINDDETHTIVYSLDGTRAFRFSETALPLNVVTDESVRANRSERGRSANLENVERIYEFALTNVANYWTKRRRRRKEPAEDAFRLPATLPDPEAPTIANVAKLLGQYYGVSLLIEVRL